MSMLDSIKAVAYDIDGTLYPDWQLYARLVPYFFSNIKFFVQYNAVRKILHKTAPLPDFYEYQARLLAQKLQTTATNAKLLIKQNVYDGLRKYFDKVKPFPYAIQTAKEFKKLGLKLAILSDFPPEQKGDIWGLKDICDVVLSSENIGALKPSLYPFAILAKELKLNPQNILYVGNSIRCDVLGAKNAGMKIAFKTSLLQSLCPLKDKRVDFCFCNYKRLKDYVLKNI